MRRIIAVLSVVGLMLIALSAINWDVGASGCREIKSDAQLSQIVGGASGCHQSVACTTAVGCNNFEGAECAYFNCGCKNDKGGCNKEGQTCAVKTCA